MPIVKEVPRFLSVFPVNILWIAPKGHIGTLNPYYVLYENLLCISDFGKIKDIKKIKERID